MNNYTPIECALFLDAVLNAQKECETKINKLEEALQEACETSAEKDEIIKAKDAAIRKLEDAEEHLLKCKEFESNLQIEVLVAGTPLLDKRGVQTINVDECWEAIKQTLTNANQEENNQG